MPQKKAYKSRLNSGQSSDDENGFKQPLSPRELAIRKQGINEIVSKALPDNSEPESTIINLEDFASGKVVLSPESALKVLRIDKDDMEKSLGIAISQINGKIDNLQTWLNGLKDVMEQIRKGGIKPLNGIVAEAQIVFGDRQRAMQFIVSPRSDLDGAKPLDLIGSEEGIAKIEKIPGTIFYG